MESSESQKSKDETPRDSPKSNLGDVKNRGWPKGKKRYPKSPGAPKQPLSGYVHFLNDRRETVRKESPEMSFADISKKLANEWSQLGQEEKQKYVEKAEIDKGRYSREFQEYQQTDDYKDFIAQQEAAKKTNGSDSKVSMPSSSKKSKKSKKRESSENHANDDSNRSSPSIDIPIFRGEFLELNKARESELRSLRKTVSEFEEQNAVLQKHVENMRSAVSKLERDVNSTKENNDALEKQYESMKKLIVSNFSGVHAHGIPTITMENAEESISKLLERAQENPQLKEIIKETVSKIDLGPITLNQ